MTANPIPAKLRRLVEERSEGVCEGCGSAPATNLHHRQFLSRGGVHAAWNLIHLCGMGNTSGGCHGKAHGGDGEALGWSVHSWDDPQHVPVLYRGVEKWLTGWGSAVDVGEVVF